MPPFELRIFESEYKEIENLVLKFENIETGGDLFGLWTIDTQPVIQFIIGPGEQCRRTSVSFHQDVNYLGNVGGFLNTSFMLCHIGSWHSHHQLSLTHPSHGDHSTVRNNFPAGLDRYIMIIANIVSQTRTGSKSVELHPYMFSCEGKVCVDGQVKVIPCLSPFRKIHRVVDEIVKGAERNQENSNYPRVQHPTEKSRNQYISYKQGSSAKGYEKSPSVFNKHQVSVIRNVSIDQLCMYTSPEGEQKLTKIYEEIENGHGTENMEYEYDSCNDEEPMCVGNDEEPGSRSSTPIENETRGNNGDVREHRELTSISSDSNPGNTSDTERGIQQWYESDQGKEKLKIIREDIISNLKPISEVEFSREKESQDLTMLFCHNHYKWTIQFPKLFDERAAGIHYTIEDSQNTPSSSDHVFSKDIFKAVQKLCPCENCGQDESYAEEITKLSTHSSQELDPNKTTTTCKDLEQVNRSASLDTSEAESKEPELSLSPINSQPRSFTPIQNETVNHESRGNNSDTNEHRELASISCDSNPDLCFQIINAKKVVEDGDELAEDKAIDNDFEITEDVEDLRKHDHLGKTTTNYDGGIEQYPSSQKSSNTFEPQDSLNMVDTKTQDEDGNRSQHQTSLGTNGGNNSDTERGIQQWYESNCTTEDSPNTSSSRDHIFSKYIFKDVQELCPCENCGQDESYAEEITNLSTHSSQELDPDKTTTTCKDLEQSYDGRDTVNRSAPLDTSEAESKESELSSSPINSPGDQKSRKSRSISRSESDHSDNSFSSEARSHETVNHESRGNNSGTSEHRELASISCDSNPDRWSQSFQIIDAEEVGEDGDVSKCVHSHNGDQNKWVREVEDEAIDNDFEITEDVEDLRKHDSLEQTRANQESSVTNSHESQDSLNMVDTKTQDTDGNRSQHQTSLGANGGNTSDTERGIQQWYESEQGKEKLKIIREDIISNLKPISEVEFSRDKESWDLTILFSHNHYKWTITFPRLFNERAATIDYTTEDSQNTSSSSGHVFSKDIFKDIQELCPCENCCGQDESYAEEITKLPTHSNQGLELEQSCDGRDTENRSYSLDTSEAESKESRKQRKELSLSPINSPGKRNSRKSHNLPRRSRSSGNWRATPGKRPPPPYKWKSNKTTRASTSHSAERRGKSTTELTEADAELLKPSTSLDSIRDALQLFLRPDEWERRVEKNSSLHFNHSKIDWVIEFRDAAPPKLYKRENSSRSFCCDISCNVLEVLKDCCRCRKCLPIINKCKTKSRKPPYPKDVPSRKLMSSDS